MVIGLYLNPPQRAAVFRVDENTATQTLDRGDPVLPVIARGVFSGRLQQSEHGSLDHRGGLG